MAALLTTKANEYQGGTFNSFIEHEVKRLLHHDYYEMVPGDMSHFKEELFFELMNVPDSIHGDGPGLTDHDVVTNLTDQEDLDEEMVPDSDEEIFWMGLVKMPQGSHFTIVITGVSNDDLEERYQSYLACLAKENEE
jgi:hypothetical protein